MELILKHFTDIRDGKESHEVYSQMRYGYSTVNSGIESGYGDTYEEALSDHMEKLGQHILRLQAFRVNINNKTVTPIQMNRRGRTVKE